MTDTAIDRDLEDRLTAAGVHHLTANHLASLDPVERADAERLAEARQELAEAGGGRTGWYAWAGLTEDERAGSTVAALHYLRAARAAGLACSTG